MGDYSDAPSAGKVPYAIGQASILRIPVPGMHGLCIEFRPRGRTPLSGSTSTLFIQDAVGRRQPRLDYGFNPQTKTFDYHWNHDRVYKEFGIINHTSVSAAGGAVYRVAKYFRYAGRLLFVAGLAIEGVEIVQATKPLRRASEAVVGLAAAWIGCKALGAAGAALGTTAAPGFGTAAGGVIGCVVGGLGGYAGGASVAGGVYDWGEGASFMRLPLVP